MMDLHGGQPVLLQNEFQGLCREILSQKRKQTNSNNKKIILINICSQVEVQAVFWQKEQTFQKVAT